MAFKKLAAQSNYISSISKKVPIQQISNWVYASSFPFKNSLSFTLTHYSLLFGLLLFQFQMLAPIKVKPFSLSTRLIFYSQPEL
jgi:hypothetical protein